MKRQLLRNCVLFSNIFHWHLFWLLAENREIGVRPQTNITSQSNHAVEVGVDQRNDVLRDTGYV